MRILKHYVRIRIFTMIYEKAEHRSHFTFKEFENDVNNLLNDFDDNQIYDIVYMQNEACIMVIHQAIDESR